MRLGSALRTVFDPGAVLCFRIRRLHVYAGWTTIGPGSFGCFFPGLGKLHLVSLQNKRNSCHLSQVSHQQLKPACAGEVKWLAWGGDVNFFGQSSEVTLKKRPGKGDLTLKSCQYYISSGNILLGSKH